MEKTTEYVKFRLFNMPCCGQLLCWVNPRLPNYCPECGKHVFTQLKFHPEDHVQVSSDAKLVINDNVGVV